MAEKIPRFSDPQVAHRKGRTPEVPAHLRVSDRCARPGAAILSPRHLQYFGLDKYVHIYIYTVSSTVLVIIDIYIYIHVYISII